MVKPQNAIISKLLIKNVLLKIVSGSSEIAKKVNWIDLRNPLKWL